MKKKPRTLDFNKADLSTVLGLQNSKLKYLHEYRHLLILSIYSMKILRT